MGLEAYHRATQGGTILSGEDFEYWQAKLITGLPPDMPPRLRQKLMSLYKYANECSLRTRLKVLLRKTLKLSKLEYTQENCNRFIDFVVENRNRLTHGTKAVEVDLVRPNQDLTTILLRLLLMHIGCGEDSIASAARRLPWSQLAGGHAE
jgi:hypothetical protein